MSGGGVVTFSSDCTIFLTSQITIGADTTLDGAGHTVAISGSGLVPIFNVSATVSLLNVTLANGKSGQGGALYVNPGATVLASNCTFMGNSAAGAAGYAGTAGRTNSTGSGTDGTDGTAGWYAMGGAIYNAGTLTLRNCTVSTNTCTAGAGGAGGNGGSGRFNGGKGGAGASGGFAYGGAICNQASLTIIYCNFAGNTVTGGNAGAAGAGGDGGIPGRGGTGAAGGGAYGGAVYNDKNLVVKNCTFQANTAQAGNSTDGGMLDNGNGIAGFNGGDAYGGGVCTLSWAGMTNSTFFANKAIGGHGGNGGNANYTAGNGGNGGNAVGGGVGNNGTVTLVFCTLSTGGAIGGTNGVAGSGAFGGSDGIAGVSGGGDIGSAAGYFTIVGSILHTNSSGSNAFGGIIDGGYNMSTDWSMTFDGRSFPNTDPQLGSLTAGLGPTPVMPLLSNSPARDKIPFYLFSSIDQRGVHRPINGLYDIGSYEFDTATHTAPVITMQPSNQTVAASSPATFTVSASGATPLSYQWQFNSTNIPGATSTTYTIASAQTTNQGPYRAIVTNAFGSVTSQVATLTVTNSAANSPPNITVQPTNQTVAASSPATFSVSASGATPLSYQWQFNSTNLPGATSTSYTIPSAQTNNQGPYRAIVTNAFGSATSQVATLTVTNSSAGATSAPPFSVQVAPAPGAGSSNVSLSFPAAQGYSYVTDYKTNLTAAWKPLMTNPGTGGWVTNVIPTTNGPSRFFRVRTQ